MMMNYVWKNIVIYELFLQIKTLLRNYKDSKNGIVT